MRRLSLSLLLCVLATSASAEQLSYMDSSGNLHFVDSVSQIPSRYRSQVVPPTPTPVMDQAALMRLQQERMQYEQQQRMRQQQAQQVQNMNQQDALRRRNEEIARRREIEKNVQLERDRTR